MRVKRLSTNFIVVKYACLITTWLPFACAAQTATFIGNCAFRIQLGEWTLYSDFPYESGYSGYDTYTMPSDFNSAKGTALITHAHRDHFDSVLFAATALELIAAHQTAHKNAEAVGALKARGITVHVIPTQHAGMPHNSYIVEWNGRRLYFTGDTESTEALLKAEDLDVVFVTSWLIDAVNEAGGIIDAKTVIVYHHENAVFDGSKVKAPCQSCRLIVPKQGDVLQLFQ